MSRHKPIKVKVLECIYEELVGLVVETCYRASNGVVFVSRYGMIFLPNGSYEEV